MTSLSWRLILKKGLPGDHLPEVHQQVGTCKFEAPKNHPKLFNVCVRKGGKYLPMSMYKAEALYFQRHED